MDPAESPQTKAWEWFVSHAQNAEDVMLWRALSTVKRGFYIDVGAADPDIHTVTRAFYERGWSGINVEPRAEPFNALNRRRGRDINLRLALSDVRGEQVFHVVGEPTLSTLDSTLAEHHRASGFAVHEARIAVNTLADVCRRYAKSDIHFLTIDVEGAELQVLRGADFVNFRPWIVLAEAVFPNRQIETHQTWEPVLIQADYRPVWFDGLNRFYVAAERYAELSPHFRLPPNVFDGYILADPAKDARERELAETRAELEILRARVAMLEAAQSEAGASADQTAHVARNE
jgi:FkbM family methyltransferase